MQCTAAPRTTLVVAVFNSSLHAPLMVSMWSMLLLPRGPPPRLHPLLHATGGGHARG